MPATNMYAELSANTNLKALADIQDISSITAVANGLLANETDVVKRGRIIEYFYDKMLLDTIKLGSENNVYLKYCKTKEVPAGNAKLLLRRWGGITEHTVPLAEGVPPKSDMMASESFSGTFGQYGRYMEFSDRVEFNIIDDVIAHYSMQYGEVAVKTGERLCREEMIFFSNPVYAEAKAGVDELCLGDTIGVEDYRLQALKFQRTLVKPLNGDYVIICSPEHTFDLVSDPLVKEYMKLTQTAEPYKTGKPVELFNLRFEETMLDDYAYGYDEIANPGEYKDGTAFAIRLLSVLSQATTHLKDNATTPAVLPEGTELYLNYLDPATPECRIVADKRLKDGSYIPQNVAWDIFTSGTTPTGILTHINSGTGSYTGSGTAGTAFIKGIWFRTPAMKLNGTDPVLLSGSTASTSVYTTDEIAELTALSWYQLPVHRSFMFGDEYMIKTGISGRSGAKFYAKPKGSAGVLDPIDQRQSVGYKIDTLGFTCVRPEALVQFVFVPSKALLTYMAVVSDYANHFNDAQYAVTANNTAVENATKFAIR